MFKKKKKKKASGPRERAVAIETATRSTKRSDLRSRYCQSCCYGKLINTFWELTGGVRGRSEGARVDCVSVTARAVVFLSSLIAFASASLLLPVHHDHSCVCVCVWRRLARLKIHAHAHIHTFRNTHTRTHPPLRPNSPR